MHISASKKLPQKLYIAGSLQQRPLPNSTCFWAQSHEGCAQTDLWKNWNYQYFKEKTGVFARSPHRGNRLSKKDYRRQWNSSAPLLY